KSVVSGLYVARKHQTPTVLALTGVVVNAVDLSALGTPVLTLTFCTNVPSPLGFACVGPSQWAVAPVPVTWLGVQMKKSTDPVGAPPPAVWSVTTALSNTFVPLITEPVSPVPLPSDGVVTVVVFNCLTVTFSFASVQLVLYSLVPSVFAAPDEPAVSVSPL